MFFSQEAIHRALSELENVQPFYGITFLVCKKNDLPIGDLVPFSISGLETSFLDEYYKPLTYSKYYFRVFRPSDKSKFWLEPNYSSTGSQSNRTQKFGDAFIHPKGSNYWGWVYDYVKVLVKNLQNDQKVPLISLAIWLYRNKSWELKNRSFKDVYDYFINDFKITTEELEIFSLSVPIEYQGGNLWSEEVYDWSSVKNFFSISNPLDAPATQIKNLKSLTINNIGPAKNFELNFNKRLNLITGDNGLGKTFILESIWWALTNTWTGDPLYPNNNNRNNTTTIAYTTENSNNELDYQLAYYSITNAGWQKIDQSSDLSLIIYAKADGLFAVMDPNAQSGLFSEDNGRALIFTKKDVWDGLTDSDIDASSLRSRRGFTNFLCNGLINDWTNWQRSNDSSFEVLNKVLKRLSPPKVGDLGTLEPGDLTRIPGDSRTVPTVRHPYGEVPVVYASEAVKRILSMAYLIVWTWQEHKLNSHSKNIPTVKNMIFMVDEIETHLHPQWQRSILPTLLKINEDLDKELNIQFVVTTHSPIVLGSIENLFNFEKDKLFHLDIDKQFHREMKVELNDVDFEKRGTIDSWLTSEIFSLDQPRGSLKSEEIINKAIVLQSQKDVTKEQVERMTNDLRNYLPAHDRFWVRWRAYADRYNIDV